MLASAKKPRRRHRCRRRRRCTSSPPTSTDRDAKICEGGAVGTAGSPDLWPLASPSSRLPTRRSVPRVVAPAGGGGGGERVVAPLLSSAHCSAVRNSLLLPDSPIFHRARPGRARLAGSRSGGAWCSRRSYRHPPLAPFDCFIPCYRWVLQWWNIRRR